MAVPPMRLAAPHRPSWKQKIASWLASANITQMKTTLGKSQPYQDISASSSRTTADASCSKPPVKSKFNFPLSFVKRQMDVAAQFQDL